MQLRNPSLQTTRTQFFIYFVLSVIAIYFAYAPAINIPFYHHDIYKFSTGGFHQACSSDQGFSFIVTLGRPGTAYFDCLNNKLGNTLASIAYLRIFCVLLIAAMMSWFALSMRRSSIPFWAAFFLCGSIFFLPGMQTVVIMIASYMIIAIMLAFASHYFISCGGLSNWKNRLIFLFGWGLLLASFATYQPLAAFFLMPAFLSVLFKPLSAWSETRKALIRDVIIFGISCVTYYIIAKLMQQYRDVENAVPQSYQLRLNFHFLDRIIGLYNYRSLWSLDINSKLTLLMNTVMFVGFIAALKNFLKNKSASISSLVQAILAVGVLLLSINAVYMAAPAPTPVSRVLFVFQAAQIILIFWSLLQVSELFAKQKEKIILLSSVILFLIGAYLANYVVTLSALNDYTELNFVSASILQRIEQNKEPIKRIHIVSPSVENFNGEIEHEDIFNNNSTQYAGDMTNIVNAAMLRFSQRHTFGLKNCMYTEVDEEKHLDEEAQCINTTPSGDIAVTYSRPGKPIYSSPGTLIINMGTLAPLTQSPKMNLSEWNNK